MADDDAVAGGDDQSLDRVSEILGRVVVAEKGQGVTVDELEAARRVGQRRATHPREYLREHDHGSASRDAHLVFARSGEPRADHQAGARAAHGLHKLRHFAGVVLPIGVELERMGIAVPDGVLEARAQRAPDTQIEGEVQGGGIAEQSP